MVKIKNIYEDQGLKPVQIKYVKNQNVLVNFFRKFYN